MNRPTAILVLAVVILSAFVKDSNGQALHVIRERELKGKSSKSRRNLDVNGHVFDGDRDLKGKSSKSRRALDLDGESELEFDEVELIALIANGVEIDFFEGDRELKSSSGSKSSKSRRLLVDVDGAHVFDGDRRLKGKSSKSRRNLDVKGSHVVGGDRELKGKSSKSRRNLDVDGHIFDGDRDLKGKSSKSRRALDLDGESELEFDEVELIELNVDEVEIDFFEGDRELKGSSGSKSGKSRRNLDVNGAHVFDGNRELKGKSSKSRRNLDVKGPYVFVGDRDLKGKSSKSRRALELNDESELEFEEVELDKLEFEGLLRRNLP